jgi:hypothetical protein
VEVLFTCLGNVIGCRSAVTGRVLLKYVLRPSSFRGFSLFLSHALFLPYADLTFLGSERAQEGLRRSGLRSGTSGEGAKESDMVQI